MELDRALELAVVSSWEELVNPGESCSIHVEYENISELPEDLPMAVSHDELREENRHHWPGSMAPTREPDKPLAEPGPESEGESEDS